MLRLDRAQYRFAVAYKPGSPQSLAEWQDETGALLVVNGGFFTPEFQATGLTIVGGESFGSSYVDFGGMFAVTDAGPQIWSLATQPYDPAVAVEYGLQGFPMLILPGGQPGQVAEDGRPARRTVVAVDRNGRLLFIIAAQGHFSLAGLSAYLLQTDLELAVALNLDGGASSGYLLLNDNESEPAFSWLPTVITVYPR